MREFTVMNTDRALLNRHKFEPQVRDELCTKCGYAESHLSHEAFRTASLLAKDQAAVAVRAVELLQAENAQLRAEIAWLRSSAVKMRLQMRTAADGLPLLGVSGE